MGLAYVQKITEGIADARPNAWVVGQLLIQSGNQKTASFAGTLHTEQFTRETRQRGWPVSKEKPHIRGCICLDCEDEREWVASMKEAFRKFKPIPLPTVPVGATCSGCRWFYRYPMIEAGLCCIEPVTQPRHTVQIACHRYQEAAK